MSFLPDLYTDAEPDEAVADAFDASDPAQVNSRKRKAARQAQDDLAAVKELMQFKQGRAFMWRLLAECHVFQAGPVHDHVTMAFAAGERNIGLRLIDMVGRASPDAYGTMIREHSNGEY